MRMAVSRSPASPPGTSSGCVAVQSPSASRCTSVARPRAGGSSDQNCWSSRSLPRLTPAPPDISAFGTSAQPGSEVVWCAWPPDGKDSSARVLPSATSIRAMIGKHRDGSGAAGRCAPVGPMASAWNMTDVAGPILDLDCLPCLPCRCNCCLMLAACRSRGAFPGGARSWLMWNAASKCEKLSHAAAATMCIVPPLSASSQFAVSSNQGIHSRR